MKEHYKCWHCEHQVIQTGNERSGLFNKWYSKDELLRKEEDYNHIDYCCPKCEKVVICRS